MSIREVNKSIRELANQANVKLYPRSLYDNYAWNGKTIAIYECDKQLRWNSHIIHDIAHYVVASRKMRDKPEFGLGSSPDIGCKKAQLLMHADKAQNQEEQSSILGILMERQLGYTWEDTWGDHTWGDMNGNAQEVLNDFVLGKNNCHAHKIMAQLKRRKLINRGCIPKIML